MKTILAILGTVFFLCMPAAQACLTTEETVVLIEIASAANLTQAQQSVFYGIFDKICNRTDTDTLNENLQIESRLLNITNNVIIAKIEDSENKTEHVLANWTAWVEKQIDFTKTINTYAKIINTSISEDSIKQKVDTELAKATDQINKRYEDMTEELDVLMDEVLTESDINGTIESLEGRITWLESEEDTPPFDMWPFAGIFLVLIIAGFAYAKWNKDREEKFALKKMEMNPSYKAVAKETRVHMSEAQEEELTKKAKKEEQAELKEKIDNETKLQESYFEEQNSKRKQKGEEKTKSEKESEEPDIGETI